jgi:photosystem II stability/assembly factor-like uncharacterized protein
MRATRGWLLGALLVAGCASSRSTDPALDLRAPDLADPVEEDDLADPPGDLSSPIDLATADLAVPPTTWTPRTSGTTLDLTAVFVTGTSVYVGGSSGTLRVSVAGGAFAPQTSNVSGTIWSIWGTSTSNLYLATSMGEIARSTNGTTWTPLTSGTTQTLYTLWGSSASDVYAVGTMGTVLRSTDGTSWTPKTSGTTETLYWVWGTSVSNVFVVGKNGTIRRTTNNGTSFTPQTSPLGATEHVYSLWGPGPMDLYASAGPGKILRSTDGATWSTLDTPVATSLLRVDGTSGNDLYALGDGGVILRSVSSGAGWVAQSSGTTQTLQAIFVRSPTTAIIVGNNGTILERN